MTLGRCCYFSLFELLNYYPLPKHGGVAQLVERWTGTPPTQVQLPCAARDLSPRVNFQCRLSHGVHTYPCAVTCINVCSDIKDPVVHVRVQWITETFQTPSMHHRLGRTTLSQLAFSREAIQISHGEIPVGQCSCGKLNRLSKAPQGPLQETLWCC